MSLIIDSLPHIYTLNLTDRMKYSIIVEDVNPTNFNRKWQASNIIKISYMLIDIRKGSTRAASYAAIIRLEVVVWGLTSFMLVLFESKNTVRSQSERNMTLYIWLYILVLRENLDQFHSMDIFYFWWFNK